MSETINLPIDINVLVLKEKLTEFEKQLVRCAANSEALECSLMDLRRVYNDLPEPIHEYLRVAFPDLITAVIDTESKNH